MPICSLSEGLKNFLFRIYLLSIFFLFFKFGSGGNGLCLYWFCRLRNCLLLSVFGSLECVESESEETSQKFCGDMKFHSVFYCCFIVSVDCNKMSLKLYFMSISPPARAVLLAIRNLGLNVEIKNVDLIAQEHLTPEFVKLNPRHQIPVLIDGDFVVTESRAIMTYLANSRKPESNLYPSDPKKRALVDERLYFDATVVFERNCAAIVS